MKRGVSDACWTGNHKRCNGCECPHHTGRPRPWFVWERYLGYLALTAWCLLFAGCASQTSLCYPNLTTQNTALGSQLGASIQEQVTGSIGWVGLVSGGIGPLVWNAVMVSGCPPTTPVQVQPVKAKLVMVP